MLFVVYGNMFFWCVFFMYIWKFFMMVVKVLFCFIVIGLCLFFRSLWDFLCCRVDGDYVFKIFLIFWFRNCWEVLVECIFFGKNFFGFFGVGFKFVEVFCNCIINWICMGGIWWICLWFLNCCLKNLEMKLVDLFCCIIKFCWLGLLWFLFFFIGWFMLFCGFIYNFFFFVCL